MQNSTSSVGEVISTTRPTMNNDNVSKTNITNNDIDNVAKSKQVDLIAEKLVLALNNPNGREYYCKVAWRLPEAVIWNNLEQSAKGREPAKLFTWLCQKEMDYHSTKQV